MLPVPWLVVVHWGKRVCMGWPFLLAAVPLSAVDMMLVCAAALKRTTSSYSREAQEGNTDGASWLGGVRIAVGGMVWKDVNMKYWDFVSCVAFMCSLTSASPL